MKSLESKVTAAVVGAAVFVPTVIWLFNLLGVPIDNDAALGLVVVLILVGGGVAGVLWPSRTSVVSDGFRPSAIPFDPLLRERIKAEVTMHPGSVHPKDPNTELG